VWYSLTSEDGVASTEVDEFAVTVADLDYDLASHAVGNLVRSRMTWVEW
jgi:hypothetical protein